MQTTVDLNDLSLDELLPHLVSDEDLSRLIETVRREDLGDAGDLTSNLLIQENATASAHFRARAPGVLAGGALLERTAAAYDGRLDIVDPQPDGSAVLPDEIIATLAGPLRSILAAERVILNFITHLSGIATLTARYVHAVAGTRARIHDTRKTIPGLRGLGKYAVRCGGGHLHRLGLHDGILIKDNHLAHLIPSNDLQAVLRDAVDDARRLDPRPAFVEIEVDTLDQLPTVLECGPDIILLDNMTPRRIAEAVAIRDRQRPDVQLEASGGVNLDTVRPIAETGIDRIAIGALTHSAPALDIALDFH